MIVTVYFLTALTTCANVNATAAHLGVNHTLCQPQSSYASTPISSLTAAEQQEIVDYHNEIRRNVTVNATNMLQMEWDDDLANLAEKWASACIDGHDDNLARHLYRKTDVGQNIYASTAQQTWNAAMKSWADESQDFIYGENAVKVVGHYTQMIWATTHKVGCSYVQCSNLDYGHRYICNYGPAGNVVSPPRISKATPYINGIKASSCKTDNDGLCDCTDTDCYNAGTLDPKTCSCSCVNWFTSATGDDCGTLVCRANLDNLWCKTIGLRACAWYWQYCPIYCNWCTV